MKTLNKGDKINVMKPLMSGWKGTGTVVAEIGGLVYFEKEDRNDIGPSICLATECKKKKTHNQTHTGK